jgi:hypothetical protein
VRRAAHWLINFAAAVSLLMCAAMVVLWVRSYFSVDDFTYRGVKHAVAIRSDSGNFYVITSRFMLPFPGWALPFTRELYYNGSGLPDVKWRFPYYSLAVWTSLLPGYWFLLPWVRAREAARKDGFCRVCGYDLRATPHRCPECGAVPPAAKEAAA